MANYVNGYGVPSTRMSYTKCKWERILGDMFDNGLKSMEIGLHETGHESVMSLKNACQSALKRLGKGTMYKVNKSANGIIVTKAY